MKRVISIIAILAALPTISFAGGSDGTRGGGEIVWTNGEGHLRDLVDPSVCENKMGTEIRAENREIDRVLGKLAELDWYFAAGLKREISLLDVCFTKRLVRVPTKDWDSVIVYEPHPKDQAAIRFIDSHDVYVNRDYYEEMPVRDRAYLMVHEAMHSFISLTAPHRNESVRLAVKTIERAANGEIKSSKILHAALDRASVNYPWTAVKLREYRAGIEFALGDISEQRNSILVSNDIDGLFRIDTQKIAGLIAPDHIADLYKNPADRAGSILEESGVDFALLDKVVNSNVTAFDPLTVAFSTSAANENSEYQARIIASRAMQAGPLFFQKMLDKSLRVENYRIVGNGGYYLLGIAPSPQSTTQPTPALAVRPYSVAELESVPSEVFGFFRLIGNLAKRGDAGLEAVRILTSNNDAFYTAFSVRDLERQLTEISAPIAREKSYLAAGLPEYVRGLRNTLHYTIEQATNKETADQIDLEINWYRLGLTDLTR